MPRPQVHDEHTAASAEKPADGLADEPSLPSSVLASLQWVQTEQTRTITRMRDLLQECEEMQVKSLLELQRSITPMFRSQGGAQYQNDSSRNDVLIEACGQCVEVLQPRTESNMLSRAGTQLKRSATNLAALVSADDPKTDDEENGAADRADVGDKKDAAVKAFATRMAQGESLADLHLDRDSGQKRREARDAVVQSGCASKLAFFLHWLVHQHEFDIFISLIILVNSICIGIQTQLSLDGSNDDLLNKMKIVELACAVVYCIELGLRIFAEGFSIFYNKWIRFDVLLVAISVASIVVDSLGDQEDQWWIVIFKVWGSLRLLRIIRALRMASALRTMWRLVYGLIASFNIILSMSLLLAVGLFMFSCLAVELISKDDKFLENEETASIVKTYFSSLLRVMLTLTQFVTMDSIAGIYSPLIVQRPYLVMYFMPLLVFISISLMNLITAVLVESSMENSETFKLEEQEMIKARLRATVVPRFMTLFSALDSDDDGMITLEEMRRIPMHALPPVVFQKAAVGNMEDLFKILDIDGTGEISQEEFLEGIIEIAVLDIPGPSMQILKHLRFLRHSSGHVEEDLKQFQENIDLLRSRSLGSL
eukprot:TRINITY_DN1790_c3_g1_i1.p1 TRINITY_DN1790_c3_g1~~TRINITY_DN1790_c3_g1_i1.p1  ORF type:complete len:596 (+),score=89.61 TRINITY_DN1790_c3_g1_i1:214-2001(+)